MEDSDAALAAALAFIDSFEEPASAPEPLPLPVAAPSAPCSLVESVSSEINPATGESLERTSSGSDSSPGFDSPSHERPRGRRTRLKKSTALASKRLREKKKQEMAALVEEAAVLEARLAHLQKRAMEASTTQAVSATGRRSDAELVARVAEAVRETVAAVSRRKDGESWFNVAADEAKERWKSEALNLELRHALEDQVRLADALRGLVQGHAAGQVWRCFCRAIVYHVMLASDARAIRFSTHVSVGSVGVGQVPEAVSRASDHFAVGRPDFRPPGASCPSVSSRRHRYPATGCALGFEHDADQTRLQRTTGGGDYDDDPCGMQSARRDQVADRRHGFKARPGAEGLPGRTLFLPYQWSCAPKSSSLTGLVCGVCVFLQKHTSGDSTEKRYILEIPSVGSFDAAAFSKRFPESDRYVIVWGATAIPRCRSVMIREKGWMMVSSRQTPVGPISYAQTCLQATVSRSDGTQVHDVDTASLTALNEWCIRAQVDCQLIQNVILEESGKMGAMVPGLDLSARV